jgi:nonsense-mediated mRNA decay protein 3
MSVLVCPKCGRTSDKVAFIESFCVDCYPVRLKLPPRLDIPRCTRCGRMRMRGEWMAFSQKKISDFVVGKCRGDFDSASFDLEKQSVSFVMSGSGARIERPVDVVVSKTICSDCSRISGGYYEAIIQLRGDRHRVEKYADRLLRRLEGKTFIAKTEEKDGGLDLYVGSSKEVLGLINGLGVRSLITKKLVGREEGKRLYRTTFLIRL